MTKSKPKKRLFYVGNFRVGKVIVKFETEDPITQDNPVIVAALNKLIKLCWSADQEYSKAQE